jgi:hypothetical protein
MLEHMPRSLLRVEGLAILVGSTVLYFDAGFAWWLFVALFFAPDLGILGFTAGQRVGAAVYDTTHFEALPIALGLIGVLAESDVCVQLALIWLAHIGLDRALGYGLKYPGGFKDTHLQRV